MPDSTRFGWRPTPGFRLPMAPPSPRDCREPNLRGSGGFVAQINRRERCGAGRSNRAESLRHLFWKAANLPASRHTRRYRARGELTPEAQKKQATHGGEWPVLAKSSGEEGKLVYMLGGVCVLAVGAAGCAGVALSPCVFVIR